MSISSVQPSYSISSNTITAAAGTIAANPIYKINGTSGPFLTSGVNGTSWTNSTATTQFNSSNGKAILSIPNGKDELVLAPDSTLTVKGKVVINGLDLEERLKTIEKVLMIPERDATLEAKYPSLKKKYDEYINALGKYRTFESIKGDHD